MPLRDHFHPPLSDLRSWEEVHGQWPAVIVQHLARRLPPRYVAGPHVRLGTQVEVDVATFDARAATGEDAPAPDAPELAWSPAEPTLAVETALTDFDEYEVRVYDAARGRRLVATIELVSPANKDRPEHHNQFAAKCAALLRQGASVTLVDVVTSRNANLFAELLEALGGDEPSPDREGRIGWSVHQGAIYAAACRWRPAGERGRLEAWAHPLQLGAALPRLPLWLDGFAVPLDLEATYEQTCGDLRIA